VGPQESNEQGALEPSNSSTPLPNPILNGLEQFEGGIGVDVVAHFALRKNSRHQLPDQVKDHSRQIDMGQAFNLANDPGVSIGISLS
jgi:hypothetical protein